MKADKKERDKCNEHCHWQSCQHNLDGKCQEIDPYWGDDK